VKLISGAALALLAAAIAGCSDAPWRTAVMVVVDSDLSVPSEVDGDVFVVAAGPEAPEPAIPGFKSAFYSYVVTSFPTALQVYPSGGTTTSFSITVQLLNGLTSQTGLPATIVVSRTVKDIRFTVEHTTMLVLPMLRKCACEGTSCPPVGTPECDSIVQPTLQRYDPNLATPTNPPVAVSAPSPLRH
jgi:hypothetical protein